MKQNWIRTSAIVFSMALLIPAALLAQKEEKTKENKEKNDFKQIIITSKNDKENIVVEVKGDKVTVNGKPIEEFKNNEDVSVRVSKVKDIRSLAMTGQNRNHVFNYNNDAQTLFNHDENRAMLGVTTEKTEAGVKINSITKESAAAKIGLKEGDIIKRINETKISDPDDLSAAVRKQKPGDKVSVMYERDKKELTGTAELTQWKGNVFTTEGFSMNLEGLDKLSLENMFPKGQGNPRMYSPRQNWTRSGGTPKLGLSVQDTDDGKGVKVLEVDDDSNAAKAGLKNNDVISEIDGKAVNNTDEVVKIIKESKDKVSLMVKLSRDGKTHNIEVKMPRKIKTADL